jgi:hypothetical protein
MKYEVIKEYFEKGNLIDLLKDTKDVRDAIEDYTSQLMANVITTVEEYKEALNKLDGYYGFVLTIAGIAEVAAKSKEANELLNAKNEALSKGEKAPTDKMAEAISDINSAEYKRIANLFLNYAKICEKRMMTVQSQLNHIEFQIKNKSDSINH